ncbi:MAG TPA: hypothetical protein VFW11_24880 [Cyclobacteriaceae bacterium]|nr:hypothetical protein [Cyclobacteriaceae bacterium]
MAKSSTKNLLAFQITLTNNAFQKLQALSRRLPKNTYGFVFNNEVFFVFEVDYKKNNAIIELLGSSDDERFKALHQQLREAITKEP